MWARLAALLTLPARVSVCLSISTGVWMGSEGSEGRAALIVTVLYHLACSSLLPLLAVYEFCIQFSNKKQRKRQPGKHHIVHKSRAYTIFNYTRVSMQLTPIYLLSDSATKHLHLHSTWTRS